MNVIIEEPSKVSGRKGADEFSCAFLFEDPSVGHGAIQKQEKYKLCPLQSMSRKLRFSLCAKINLLQGKAFLRHVLHGRNATAHLYYYYFFSNLQSCLDS